MCWWDMCCLLLRLCASCRPTKINRVKAAVCPGLLLAGHPMAQCSAPCASDVCVSPDLVCRSAVCLEVVDVPQVSCGMVRRVGKYAQSRTGLI